MPAVHAWRPALVAADVIVGDHGSVTLYGAAAGTPVLLAAFGGDAVPGTAVHHLASVAPRLDPHRDLRKQLADAIREHKPERYASVAAQAFAEPGHALARLRTALYQLLKLPEPSSPPPAPLILPVPDPPATSVTSWQVTTDVTGDSAAATVTVHRIPATVTAYGENHPETASCFTHLACADDERDLRLTESASVLVRRDPAPTSIKALGWISDALASSPEAFSRRRRCTGAAVWPGSRTAGSWRRPSRARRWTLVFRPRSCTPACGRDFL